jgi:hypothetical protein
MYQIHYYLLYLLCIKRVFKHDMTQHRDMEILELLEHDTVGYNN